MNKPLSSQQRLPVRVMRCTSPCASNSIQPPKIMRCNPSALPGPISSNSTNTAMVQCQPTAQQGQDAVQPRRIMRIDRPASSRSSHPGSLSIESSVNLVKAQCDANCSTGQGQDSAQPRRIMRIDRPASSRSSHPGSLSIESSANPVKAQFDANCSNGQGQDAAKPHHLMIVERAGSSRSTYPSRVMRCNPSYSCGSIPNLESAKQLQGSSCEGLGGSSMDSKCPFVTAKPETVANGDNTFVDDLQTSGKPEILKCRKVHQSSYSLRALKTVPNYYGNCSGSGAQVEQPNTVMDDLLENCDNDQKENDSVHINMLPDEILCMIFSFLPQLDLLRVCSKVCHRWQSVSKSAPLWQTLSFCGQEIPIQIVCGSIRLSPSLKSITIKDRCDVDIILPILHQQCKRLESVNLVRCRPSELLRKTLRAKSLYPFLRKGQLRNLNLKGTDYRSAKFYQKLSSMPNLRKLNVSCSGGVTPQILCEIAKHTSLKVLKHKWHSDSVYYGPKSMTIQLPGKIDEWSNAYTLLFQKAGENLTTLEFYSAGINDSALAGLASCKKLKKLAVYNANCLGSEGMAAIGTLPELKELLIHNAKLTTVDVRDAFRNGSLSGLKCCHLNDSIATVSDEISVDACLETVAEKCRQMLHLSLTKCTTLTDAGVVALLKRCPQLLSLDINGTSGVSGQSFFLIPTLTPHLKLLVIEDDEYCPRAKKEMIKKFLEDSTVNVERRSTWKHRTTSYYL